MKLLFQILFLLLTWFTNLVNATPVFTKVVLPSYEVPFSKTENIKQEAFVKIAWHYNNNPDLNKILFKCITGVDLGDLVNAIEDFIIKNWDEPYYRGQATAFVATLISPYKGQILAKLRTLPKYASKISKFEKLAKAKTADELIGLTKSLDDVVKGAGKYWRTSVEMRDDVMAWAKAYQSKLPTPTQLDKFSKATAASYKKADGTIETVFGRNGGVLNTQSSFPTISAEKNLGLHKELADRLPTNTKWPNTANCAECDAVNQALHNGAKWEDIQIHTIDIRSNGTMTDVIQCSECENIFKGMYVTSQ